jgi:hypothetical protein
MRHHRPRPPNLSGEHSHADLRDLTLTFAPIAIFVVVVITLVVWLVDPAPPHTITMSAAEGAGIGRFAAEPAAPAGY